MKGTPYEKPEAGAIGERLLATRHLFDPYELASSDPFIWSRSGARRRC